MKKTKISLRAKARTENKGSGRRLHIEPITVLRDPKYVKWTWPQLHVLFRIFWSYTAFLDALFLSGSPYFIQACIYPTVIKLQTHLICSLVNPLCCFPALGVAISSNFIFQFCIPPPFFFGGGGGVANQLHNIIPSPFLRF